MLQLKDSILRVNLKSLDSIHLQDEYLKCKYTDRSKVKEWEKIYRVNTNPKAGMKILMLDKGDFYGQKHY